MSSRVTSDGRTPFAVVPGTGKRRARVPVLRSVSATAGLTWIWLIFGAIQLRYGEKTRNFPSPFMQLPTKNPELPLTPGPSPQGEGGFYAVPAPLPGERGVQTVSQGCVMAPRVGRPKQWDGMFRVRRTFRRRCRGGFAHAAAHRERASRGMLRPGRRRTG